MLAGQETDRLTNGDGRWIGSLHSWEGEEIVNYVASPVGNSCNLDVGNGMIRMNSIRARDVSAVRGGIGLDLADFSRMTSGVVSSLNLTGAVQASGAGQIGLTGFVNPKGSTGVDRPEGAAVADLYECATEGGNDEVTDFAIGVDHLPFAGTGQPSDITFATRAGGVSLSIGAGLVLIDVVTLARIPDATNFVFG